MCARALKQLVFPRHLTSFSEKSTNLFLGPYISLQNINWEITIKTTTINSLSLQLKKWKQNHNINNNNQHCKIYYKHSLCASAGLHSLLMSIHLNFKIILWGNLLPLFYRTAEYVGDQEAGSGEGARAWRKGGCEQREGRTNDWSCYRPIWGLINHDNSQLTVILENSFDLMTPLKGPGNAQRTTDHTVIITALDHASKRVLSQGYLQVKDLQQHSYCEKPQLKILNSSKALMVKIKS